MKVSEATQILLDFLQKHGDLEIVSDEKPDPILVMKDPGYVVECASCHHEHTIFEEDSHYYRNPNNRCSRCGGPYELTRVAVVVI